MIYLDSSALVKRYVREQGTQKLATLTATGEAMVISRLAYPEILSAFMRKRRAGEIGRKSLENAIHMFEEDWGRFVLVEIHDELLPVVRSMAQRHALKGADVVHLSTAVWVRNAAKMPVTMVASDADLLAAARAEGLVAIDPQDAS